MIMKIMNIVVPVSLLLMTNCFGLENRTDTQLEQQLKVQRREMQYLIGDDPNEGPEQKRDERQSISLKNNNNLDVNGNSRIINIRHQPPTNILKAPKQVIKTEVLPKRIDTTPQRIPTKIPGVLKTVKVVPGPAHAIRMKILENKINQSLSNANKEKAWCQNNFAPPTSVIDSIPYYIIEDKMSRRTESSLSPNEVDDENSNIESHGTLNRDGKETSSIVGKTLENKDSNNFQNEGEHDQVTSNSDKKATEIKPIHFFVDEPEPLPPSFRRQQKLEDTAPQSKEVTINKPKELAIIKKGATKSKKDDFRKIVNDNDDTDPDIVRIANGTHLISIKKIKNPDKFKTERLLSRNGQELTVPTEERIVNQEPPKSKPVVDEPEKYTLSITEKLNTGKDKTVGLTGLVFKDNKSKEEKDINDCITITNYNYEEIKEQSPISPPLTLVATIPPIFNEGNQETWNYRQNPYYNAYYQNLYDQYRQNHGLTQNTPNLHGQAMDPRNYGALQINPYIYGQQNIDPTGSEITLPYYPNGKPSTDTGSSEYPYTPIANKPQPEIADVPCLLGSEIYPENTSNRIWGTWKDMEVKIRKGQTNDAYEPLDIDIRRTFDDIGDGNKADMSGKVVNPYATSSLPISLNGALIFPYVNSGNRYMR